MRRHRVAVLIASVVALVLAGAGGGFAAYAANYAPLQWAGWAGPDSQSVGKLRMSDPIRIKGGAGTTVRLTFGLLNTGRWGVHVDGIALNDVVVAADWSEYHFTPEGAISGDPRPWRDFGASVGEGDQIRVRVTIRQPSCAHGANGGLGFGILAVRWHAFGWHHVTPVDIQPEEPYLEFCPAR